MPIHRNQKRPSALRGPRTEGGALRRRQVPENGGRRWTARETEMLVSARTRGVPYKEIAKAFGKSELGCRLHYMNFRKRESNRSEAQTTTNASNAGQWQLQPSYNRYAHIAPAPAVPRPHDQRAFPHPHGHFREVVPARNQDARGLQLLSSAVEIAQPSRSAAIYPAAPPPPVGSVSGPSHPATFGAPLPFPPAPGPVLPALQNGAHRQPPMLMPPQPAQPIEVNNFDTSMPAYNEPQRRSQNQAGNGADGGRLSIDSLLN